MSRKPPKRKARKPIPGSGERFQHALERLGKADILAAPVIDNFADRCGIARASVYRWIAGDAVPGWAEWIVALLLERQQIASKLTTPAE